MMPIEILLVEDSPSDVALTRKALSGSKMLNNLHVAKDGEVALDFLYQRGVYTEAPRPDLILLDLNLPNIEGREVLETIKHDPDLRIIPVVILTTSSAPEDIRAMYERYANSFISKPIDMNEFLDVVRSIEDFWFTVVKLPRPN